MNSEKIKEEETSVDNSGKEKFLKKTNNNNKNKKEANVFLLGDQYDNIKKIISSNVLKKYKKRNYENIQVVSIQLSEQENIIKTLTVQKLVESNYS